MPNPAAAAAAGDHTAQEASSRTSKPKSGGGAPKNWNANFLDEEEEHRENVFSAAKEFLELLQEEKKKDDNLYLSEDFRKGPRNYRSATDDHHRERAIKEKQAKQQADLLWFHLKQIDEVVKEQCGNSLNSLLHEEAQVLLELKLHSVVETIQAIEQGRVDFQNNGQHAGTSAVSSSGSCSTSTSSSNTKNFSTSTSVQNLLDVCVHNLDQVLSFDGSNAHANWLKGLCFLKKSSDMMTTVGGGGDEQQQNKNDLQTEPDEVPINNSNLHQAAKMFHKAVHSMTKGVEFARKFQLSETPVWEGQLRAYAEQAKKLTIEQEKDRKERERVRLLKQEEERRKKTARFEDHEGRHLSDEELLDTDDEELTDEHFQVVSDEETVGGEKKTNSTKKKEKRSSSTSKNDGSPAQKPDQQGRDQEKQHPADEEEDQKPKTELLLKKDNKAVAAGIKRTCVLTKEQDELYDETIALMEDEEEEIKALAQVQEQQLQESDSVGTHKKNSSGKANSSGKTTLKRGFLAGKRVGSGGSSSTASGSSKDGMLQSGTTSSSAPDPFAKWRKEHKFEFDGSASGIMNGTKNKTDTAVESNYNEQKQKCVLDHDEEESSAVVIATPAGEDVDRREATGNEAGCGVPSSEEENDDEVEEADFQHQNTARKTATNAAEKAEVPAGESGTRDIDDAGPREEILTAPAEPEDVLLQGKPEQEDTKNGAKSSKKTLLPREEGEEEIIPADTMDAEVVKEDERPAAFVSSPNPVVNDAGTSVENAVAGDTATALIHPCIHSMYKLSIPCIHPCIH
ncbi:unnamed protein product [Amoebophrya sp. A120]|nr:unnamed protein product [Amoebophrya sp. A120]|eukprot:GSA120T00013730001.1